MVANNSSTEIPIKGVMAILSKRDNMKKDKVLGISLPEFVKKNYFGL